MNTLDDYKILDSWSTTEELDLCMLLGNIDRIEINEENVIDQLKNKLVPIEKADDPHQYAVISSDSVKMEIFEDLTKAAMFFFNLGRT